jgi:hypothetical protein
VNERKALEKKLDQSLVSQSLVPVEASRSASSHPLESEPADPLLTTLLGEKTQCFIDGEMIGTMNELSTFCGDATDTMIRLMSRNVAAMAQEVLDDYLKEEAQAGQLYGLLEGGGTPTDTGNSKNNNHQRFEINKRTHLHGDGVLSVKFYTQGELKSVYRKGAQGKELDQIDLEPSRIQAAIFDEDDKELILNSRKTAEIAVTLELIKGESIGNQTPSYSINCREFSHHYKIKKLSKWSRWIRSFVNWKR